MTRALRWGILACVSLEFVALGLWVGGLAVLVAAVIPAVFNTFGGQDSGGLFLTRAFEGYNRMVLGAMVLLVGGLAWRMWLVRPVGSDGHARSGLASFVGPTGIEVVLVAVMVIIAGVLIFILHPQAAARQAEAFALTDHEARKAALATFFKIHQPVRWLYVANLVLGVTLITVKVRAWLKRIEAGV